MSHLHLVDDDPRSEVEKAFAGEWYRDVYVLARLWQFLTFVCDERPRSVTHFLQHADEWAEQYAAMQECEYLRLRDES